MNDKPRKFKYRCQYQPYHFAGIYLGLIDKEHAKELEEHATHCEKCCETWFKISAIFAGAERLTEEEALLHIKFIASPLGDMFSELTAQDVMERVKEFAKDLQGEQDEENAESDVEQDEEEANKELRLITLPTQKQVEEDDEEEFEESDEEEEVVEEEEVNGQIMVKLELANPPIKEQVEVKEESSSEKKESESKDESNAVIAPQKTQYYLKVAAVILAIGILGIMFYTAYSRDIEMKQIKEVAERVKEEKIAELKAIEVVNSEVDPIKLAKIFEEASKQIESNSNDSTAYLRRATAAEKLMLLDQATEDFKRYCALTGANCDNQIARIEKTKNLRVEKTSYDMIDENIDQYLTSLMKYDNAAAQSYLARAKGLAEEMLQRTGDRLGVDLVSYYINISLDKVESLLEARTIRREMDKLPAIDNFSEYIPKLERAKAIFKKNSATAEVVYNSAILSRFYVKGFKYEEAQKEVDEFLQLSTDASYKLCQAGLIWVDSHLAQTKGDILNFMSLNDKSLEIFSQVDSGNVILASLMVGVEYKIEITDNDTLAFTNGLEGLKKSLKKEEGNKRLAAFASRFSRFQAVTADKMKMPRLAEAYLKYAILICDQYDVPGYKNDHYSLLATLKASQGKKEEALEMLEKSKLFISEDPITQKEDLLTTTTREGKIYGLLGNYAMSGASYKESLQLVKELGITQLIYTAELKKGLGEALQMQRKDVEAKKELIESKKIYDKARAAYQSMKAPLTRPSFTNKSVEELLDLVEAR
jgi:hypothetical protein